MHSSEATPCLLSPIRAAAAGRPACEWVLPFAARGSGPRRGRDHTSRSSCGYNSRPAPAPRSNLMPLQDEIARRRTFAIISHPDAGKTTLTEKLLLFGGAIQLAGTVKGRK